MYVNNIRIILTYFSPPPQPPRPSLSRKLEANYNETTMRMTSSTTEPTLSSMSTPTKISSSTSSQVLSLYVIYNADGTLTGEFLYMAKKALGLAHCAACDITHGPRREKPEFTALKTTTGWTVPLINIHRDEMDETMDVCVNGILPCVVARTDNGDFLLVRPQELEECASSVDSFVYIVDERAEKMKFKLNRAPNYCQLNNIQQQTALSDTTTPTATNILHHHDLQVPVALQAQHHQQRFEEFERSIDDVVVPAPS